MDGEARFALRPTRALCQRGRGILGDIQTCKKKPQHQPLGLSLAGFGG